MSPLLRGSLALLLLAATVYGEELRITASTQLQALYVDGVHIPNLPNSGATREVDRVPIHQYTRLVSVTGRNAMGGCSGIVAAAMNTSHRLVTDKSWKCSANPESGWQYLGFEDSHWEPAVEIARNGQILTGCGSWFPILTLPNNTYWIWTNGHIDGDETVSCRGYTDVCNLMPCENGGTCNMNQINICSCPVRWGGTLCNLPIDECDSNPCQNGGQCKLDDSGYVCECQVGYSGVHCESDITDCASRPCQHGGTCSFDIDGGYTCSCMDGFTGLDCETDIDDCANNPCLNEATCEDGINGARCVCMPGYEGEFCQNDINECLSDPCLNAATCHDNVNGFHCMCTSGYTGTTCESPIGFCESSPCQNGGTCTLNGPGGAIECICTPGWSGPVCNSDENECLSDPCKHGGTCVDGDNDYDCYCTAEWHGKNCDTVNPNCGSIMRRSGFPATNGFTILCEINVVEHEPYLSTPCNELIRGINYFNDSDTITALGGTYGCYTTKYEDEVNFACIDDYNQRTTLASCLNCLQMGVCLKYPDDPKKSSPKKK